MRLKVDKKEKRECGILLHISSLPARHGIGTLGLEAYHFVDFLKKCHQSYWQLLPLCPVGEGNSPYKSPSCFAGEILFIDLDFLVRDGLLEQEELPPEESGTRVDYDKVRAQKIPLLKKAVERFNTHKSNYIRFLKENEHWIGDYALFMSILEDSNSDTIAQMEESLKYRLPSAIETFRISHRDEIRFYKVTQYLFYSQYFALHRYASKNGIRLVGDIPIYVSLDSADVWEGPDNFKLDRDMTPTEVAGVPPDIFSETGQLWGNPIYDWEYQKKNDYLWWRNRLKHCSKLYDVVRIDHFRAFVDYYVIPYGAPDARGGSWVKGVGMPFWDCIKKHLGAIDIIAEDLGGDTPEVEALVEETGFPNMKILQFGFDSDLKNKFLPRNFNANCVCYTGTHDNDTTLGWYNKATQHEKVLFSSLVPENGIRQVSLRMISFGMRSGAKIFIAPMQDWLCLDSDARMNTPGTKGGNWEWRMPSGTLTPKLAETLLHISKERI